MSYPLAHQPVAGVPSAASPEYLELERRLMELLDSSAFRLTYRDPTAARGSHFNVQCPTDIAELANRAYELRNELRRHCDPKAATLTNALYHQTQALAALWQALTNVDDYLWHEAPAFDKANLLQAQVTKPLYDQLKEALKEANNTAYLWRVAARYRRDWEAHQESLRQQKERREAQENPPSMALTA